MPLPESDPHGTPAHTPGAKLDAGKPRAGLVLGDFANALGAVVAVGTYGAAKYSDSGWLAVPDGQQRYNDAMLRHLLAEWQGEARDADTGLLHAAHAAWNALARLELALRGRPVEPRVPVHPCDMVEMGTLQRAIPQGGRRHGDGTPPMITVATLIAELQRMPQHLPVRVCISEAWEDPCTLDVDGEDDARDPICVPLAETDATPAHYVKLMPGHVLVMGE